MKFEINRDTAGPLGRLFLTGCGVVVIACLFPYFVYKGLTAPEDLS